jgi:sugar lactone lactonase YvrE
MRGLAFDPLGSTLYAAVVTSGNLFILTVDRTTGAREIVSSAAVGMGETSVSPTSLVWDATASRLLSTSQPFGLFAVAVGDGDRTELSGPTVGTGPSTLGISLSGLTLSADDATAWLPALDGGGMMLEVELSTGNRTALRVASRGSGPRWSANPSGAAMSVDLQTLYVVDGSYQDPKIIAVNLSTGARSIVTSGAVGSGPLPQNLVDIVVTSATKAFVMSTTGYAVLEVDLTDGTRALTSGGTNSTVGTRGDGPDLATPERMRGSADGATVYISDGTTIVGVDTTSGERTLVTGGGASSANPLVRAGPLYVDPATGTIYVAERSASRVIAVNPTTGARLVAWEDAGSSWYFAGALERAPDGDLLVYTAGLVYRIDPTAGTGETESLFPDHTTIRDVFYPRSVAIAADGETALAVDGGGVFVTDLQNGESAILWR